jgi:hypothetical protein
MRGILFSFFTITISIFGFIVLPIFMIGVDLSNYPYKDITPQAIEARKNLNKMKEDGTIESAANVEKWWGEINSQPKIKYTNNELYNIAQENFLWFTWVPVFALFYLFSKNKKIDLICFIGVSISAYIFGVLILSTLIAYIGAAVFGLVCKDLKERKQGMQIEQS